MTGDRRNRTIIALVAAAFGGIATYLATSIVQEKKDIYAQQVEAFKDYADGYLAHQRANYYEIIEDRAGSEEDWKKAREKKEDARQTAKDKVTRAGYLIAAFSAIDVLSAAAKHDLEEREHLICERSETQRLKLDVYLVFRKSLHWSGVWGSIKGFFRDIAQERRFLAGLLFNCHWYDFEELPTLARQGDSRAQLVLARSYATGQDGEFDEAKAQKWFRRAADQGQGEAAFALFKNPNFNMEQHERLFELCRAAHYGTAEAQYAFAKYLIGQEKPDRVVAYMLLRLAAGNGQDEAQAFIEKHFSGTREHDPLWTQAREMSDQWERLKKDHKQVKQSCEQIIVGGTN